MHYLLETEETIAPGLGFTQFGLCHLLWLAAFVLFTAAGCVLYRRLSGRGRRNMRWLLAGGLLADEALKMAILFIGGTWLPRYLPLHLCSINIFVIGWHALRPGKMLDNFLYTVCLPGALFPLFCPEWVALPVTSLMHIHSFTVHILLAAYPIILIFAGEIRPNIRYVPKCLALLAGLAVVALGTNLVLGTNFMFLMEAPPGSPLVWFEQVFGTHLVGFPVIIVLLLLVMYAPTLTRLVKTRQTANR